MTEHRQAYPLDWPIDTPRTPAEERRSSCRFQVTLARAVYELFEELERMDVEGAVLSTNQRTRRDGRPRADDNGNRVKDPGAVIYFERDGRPQAIPCDTYDTLRGNVRALGLTLGALRSIERHGGKVLQDRAFTGFAALPADAGADGSRPWRDVLGLRDDPMPMSAKLVEERYRHLARKRHPDQGGSAAAMAELNRARDEALADLKL